MSSPFLRNTPIKSLFHGHARKNKTPLSSSVLNSKENSDTDRFSERVEEFEV